MIDENSRKEEVLDIEKIEWTISRTENMIISKNGRFILPTKRSKKTIDTQNRILNFIYQKTGLKLNVDDWCNQIENIKGKRYFNVGLGEKKTWASTFQKLKRLASYSDTVYRVEKNGTGILAIYFK